MRSNSTSPDQAVSDQAEWSDPWDEWTDGWGSFGSPTTPDDDELDAYELSLLAVFPGSEFIDGEDPGTDARLSDTAVWTIPGVTPDFDAMAASEEFARGWCRAIDERPAWAEERARNREMRRAKRGRRHRRQNPGRVEL